MMRRLLPVAACGAIFATAPAQAAVLFSQTPVANLTAYRSDLSFNTNGLRSADNFTIAVSATARSVTWRGVFDDTPPFPVTFDLTFYADASGVPASVVSTATISFTADQMIDTGIDLLDANVYEFRADITPTPLISGVTYWFSPLAETGANTDDDWFWLSNTSHDLAALQQDAANSGPWIPTAFGPNYFIIHDSPIPEPASLSLLVGSSLMFVRRRWARV